VAWSAGMGYTLVKSKSSLADMQLLSPERESPANLDRPKNLTPHGRLFWDYSHRYRTSDGSPAPFVALQPKASC